MHRECCPAVRAIYFSDDHTGAIIMEFIEKFPAWLRWILVPFVFVAAMVLVSILVRLFFWFQARMMGLGDGAWLELITDNIIAGGLTGYATVYFSCLVAPSSRRVVSLIVGGVVVMLSAWALADVLNKAQWWNAVNVVATIIGAGFAIHSIYEEEQSKDRWASSEVKL